MPFAFEKLNLSRNPFGEPTRKERMELARIPEGQLQAWLAFIEKPGHAIQFMGDAGRGKSTHLFALLRAFPDAPYTYLAEGQRFVRIPRAPVVFVDEVQRLSPLWRHFLFRRRASFVLATHEDLQGELKKAGVQVLTEEISVLGPEQLAFILKARIEWARLGPGAVPTLPGATIAALRTRFGTDLRAMEGHLYDVFQTLRVNGPVDITF
jgi:hypothetical protein